MPTKAENGHFHSMHSTRQDSCLSWTDALPVCPLSGVGYSTNQVYRLDGVRNEEHEFEDRFFRFRSDKEGVDEETFFYGVFDGQYGSKAVEFVSQRMPAEILLGQLKGRDTNQDIKDLLLQAFSTVETAFFQSMDDLLAEKENIRLQLQGLRTFEAMMKFPHAVQRLNSITAEIESGTSAVVALVHKGKLYVANVGNSRALLGQTDESGCIKICQLSVNHDFQNEDELLRLSQLGVDTERLCSQSTNCRHPNTRCIGNYVLKGGYKEYDNMSEASEEPVIAEPEIYGGIEIDASFKFLLLMSNGLYKSLEQSTGTTDANNAVVRFVVEQFAEQSTLSGVAQATVDKVVRLHHDTFMKNNEFSKHCTKRDDITLLVRNFHQSLADKHSTTQTIISEQTQMTNNEQNSNLNTLSSEVPDIADVSALPQRLSQIQLDASSLSTNSDSVPETRTLFQHSIKDISLDEENRIRPYVDFSDFYDAVEEAYKNGLVPGDWRRHHAR